MNRFNGLSCRALPVLMLLLVCGAAHATVPVSCLRVPALVQRVTILGNV